jgi:acyl-CoA thioesterase-1
MGRKIAVLVLFAVTIGCEGASQVQQRTLPASSPPPPSPPAQSASSGETARAEPERGVVLFLGTSLTAGYGLGDDLAFPALVQAMIDSAALPFRVVNAGISGETSAGGLRRLEWSLQEPIDVLVLELGANDGLRALDVKDMRANLDSILTRTHRTYPNASLVLLGMEAPPNLGATYTTAFRAVFRDLAQKHDAALVTFLLDGVAARPALNLADGIHPNANGHRTVASTVWRTLEPVLLERTSAHAGEGTDNQASMRGLRPEG